MQAKSAASAVLLRCQAWSLNLCGLHTIPSSSVSLWNRRSSSFLLQVQSPMTVPVRLQDLTLCQATVSPSPCEISEKPGAGQHGQLGCPRSCTPAGCLGPDPVKNFQVARNRNRGRRVLASEALMHLGSSAALGSNSQHVPIPPRALQGGSRV